MPRTSKDQAHRYTDEMISTLQSGAYAFLTAAKARNMKRLKNYLSKHEEGLKKRQRQLEDGEITKDEFQAWLNSTVFGREWRSLLDDMAAEYARANMSIYGAMTEAHAEVVAENINYGVWQAVTSDVRH